MSKFIVFIKNTWRDSESQIQWILYYSIRPHGRRFERQWSDTIDDEGHMTKPTWEMQHVRISFIPHNLVRTGEAGPQSTKFIAKENGRLKKDQSHLFNRLLRITTNFMASVCLKRVIIFPILFSSTNETERTHFTCKTAALIFFYFEEI